MQSEEASRLKRSWGNKPCSHPTLAREYFLGAQTGDLVCTTCGSTFWSRDEAGRDATRQTKDK